MKLQKTLALAFGQEETTLGGHIKKVLCIQKQISVLENSRKTWEIGIGEEILDIISKAERYPEFKKFLNITLFPGEENQGSVLTYIAIQIAESIPTSFKEQIKNDSGDLGFKEYKVPYEEIEKLFGLVDMSYSKRISEPVNSFLEEFGVKIEILPYDGQNGKKEANLRIKIF